jgi:uncharacterized protein YjiS (DUF1127 family)
MPKLPTKLAHSKRGESTAEAMTRWANEFDREPDDIYRINVQENAGEFPHINKMNAHDKMLLKYNPKLAGDMPPIVRDAERWVARERRKELKDLNDDLITDVQLPRGLDTPDEIKKALELLLHR